MTKSSWALIENYKDRYSVSSCGQVYSNFRGGRIRRQKVNSYGYCVVNLSINHLIRTYSVHRLVAKYFLPDYSEKLQVNHINGIKTDNRLENLEMCTASENLHHAFRLGLKMPHKTTPKLTEEDVREIRRLYSTVSLADLAARFGVAKSTACRANNGTNWGDII